MKPGCVQLNNVTVAYNRRPAIRNVCGSFEQASMTAIVGPNGAGKSSLLKALMGELPDMTGNIHRGGYSTSEFGYLPQATAVDRHFPISVADTVMLGAWSSLGAFAAVTPHIAEKAQRALAAVGLDGFERRQIGSLSAGQFQRVLFARLILQNARVVLLDEPFTAIDTRTTRDLLAIVHQWHQEGRTVIAVLHDFDQVRTHFANACLLAREVIAWGPTETTLSSGNMLLAQTLAENWDQNPRQAASVYTGAV